MDKIRWIFWLFSEVVDTNLWKTLAAVSAASVASAASAAYSNWYAQVVDKRGMVVDTAAAGATWCAPTYSFPRTCYLLHNEGGEDKILVHSDDNNRPPPEFHHPYIVVKWKENNNNNNKSCVYTIMKIVPWGGGGLKHWVHSRVCVKDWFLRRPKVSYVILYSVFSMMRE